MDLLELLLDLFMETSLEAAQSDKVPRKLRRGLAVLLVLFFGGLGILLLAAAAGSGEGLVRRLALGALGLALAGFAAGLAAAAWRKR